MIARGFKPVAWVAAIGTAALGCYMLSLSVAAERAELAGIEHRIVAARQAIRSLQTELGTRGRLQQLEQWNADVLALSAPGSGQFLDSVVSLARFDAGRTLPAVEGPVRMASAETVPSVPAPAQGDIRLASATVPAVRPDAPPAPVVRRASLEIVPAAAAPGAAAPAPAGSLRRPAALLDAGTLRDLSVRSRSEQDGGTRN